MTKRKTDTEVKAEIAQEYLNNPENFISRDRKDIELLNKDVSFIYQTLSRMDSKLDIMDKKMDRFSDKLDNRFMWMLASIGGLVLTLVGFILTQRGAI